jgi:ABC-type methionine transport system ATPase subunit
MLVEDLALRDDGICQLDGRLIEDDQVNGILAQGRREKMRQLRAKTRHRRISREQYTQVNIAERPDLSAELRSEEADQPYLSLRAGDRFDARLETLNVDSGHQRAQRV